MKTQRRYRTLPILFGLSLVVFVLIFHSSRETSSVIYNSTPAAPSSDDVNAIAGQLYCPVCENTPLDECDTEACRQWRNLIYQFLLEGKTEDEIIDFFSVTYGNRVLPVPPAKGFNWLVYVVPSLVLLLGLVLLMRTLNPWNKKGDGKQIDLVDQEGEMVDIDNLYIDKFKNEINE